MQLSNTVPRVIFQQTALESLRYKKEQKAMKLCVCTGHKHKLWAERIYGLTLFNKGTVTIVIGGDNAEAVIKGCLLQHCVK